MEGSLKEMEELEKLPILILFNNAEAIKTIKKR